VSPLGHALRAPASPRGVGAAERPAQHGSSCEALRWTPSRRPGECPPSWARFMTRTRAALERLRAIAPNVNGRIVIAAKE
jgi:hypothetical protein